MNADTNSNRPSIGLSDAPPPALHAPSRTPDRIAGAALAVLFLFAGFMVFLWLMFSMSGGF